MTPDFFTTFTDGSLFKAAADLSQEHLVGIKLNTLANMFHNLFAGDVVYIWTMLFILLFWVSYTKDTYINYEWERPFIVWMTFLALFLGFMAYFVQSNWFPLIPGL